MRSTLDQLIAEMVELKTLVASVEPVNLALAGHPDAVVQRYVSVRRRFDYAAFAVALYASFENFVESLVASYIRLESRRVGYKHLPRKLTNKHLSGTAELLWRRRLGEGRYVGMSELGVVKNLFDCLSGITPYTLNEAVVIAHDANLRAGEIDSVFGAVGIEGICDRACCADAILTWYCSAQGLDRPPQGGVKRTVIEERLKDIVERRNQVAHRGGNPDNLLGVKAMNDAIAFIESLSTSLFGLVVGRYLADRHGASAQLAQRQGEGPYRNGTIVIVEIPTQRLFVGQPVFVIARSTEARWGRIQSLKIDGGDVPEVKPDAIAPLGIGVELDFRCPKDATLTALSAEDDVVWSPMSTLDKTQ